MGIFDNLLSEGKKYVRDAMPGGLLNAEWTPERVQQAGGLLADFTPVVGGIKGAREEWQQGNPGWAAFNAATVPLDLASLGGATALKAGFLGMAKRSKFQSDLERAILEKAKQDFATPPLPADIWNQVSASRTANGQVPVIVNEPYIPSDVVDKFSWKRGGRDKQSPAEVSDMVNSAMFANKTKAAASAKNEGDATALINARSPEANIAFIEPDSVGRPVITTVYQTQTAKLPNKLGMPSGGSRLPTSSTASSSAGSEAFRLSDGTSTLAQQMPIENPKGLLDVSTTGYPIIGESGQIVVDGKPIGRVKVEKSDDATRIANIDLLGQYQGKGYGSQVIKDIVAESHAQGLPVVLTSDAMRGKANQARQRALYERLGFEKNKSLKTDGVKEEYVLYPPK